MTQILQMAVGPAGRLRRLRGGGDGRELVDEAADRRRVAPPGGGGGEDAPGGGVVAVEPEQGDVGRRRADRQCRDEGDAETGGDAAELAGPVGGDDVDLRLEAWRGAGCPRRWASRR
jgi:hypothetical protein